MKPKLLLFLIIRVIEIETARILGIFPTPSLSHQLVFRALTKELARCGHEVIFLTTDPSFTDTTNLTEIDVHNISYSNFLKEFASVIPSNKGDIIKPLEIAIPIVERVFVKQLESDEFKKVTKNVIFDLILVESFMEICLALSHVYKAPLLRVSSLGTLIDDHINMGSQRHMLIYPEYLYKRSYNLTWLERIIKVYQYFSTELMFYNFRQNSLLSTAFGPNMLSSDELRNNVEALFLNVRHIWDNNRPVALSTVYLGGVHETQEEGLSEELKSYLDSTAHGVIYMSFGTNVFPSKLPPEKIQTFVNVFSQLPYNILWKYDQNELFGTSSNVKIAKWFPQSNLLRHPNIKLFITQGGLQSMDEAITAGVPMIAFPFVCDQWYNSENFVKHKIGKQLDFYTITEDELHDAINDILEDDRSFHCWKCHYIPESIIASAPGCIKDYVNLGSIFFFLYNGVVSYRVNVAKLRTLMNDQPQSPLSRAVWWTEYVLKHGGTRHMRAPSANMAWTEYFEIELLFILFLFFIATLRILLLLINKLFGKKMVVVISA